MHRRCVGSSCGPRALLFTPTTGAVAAAPCAVTHNKQGLAVWRRPTDHGGREFPLFIWIMKTVFCDCVTLENVARATEDEPATNVPPVPGPGRCSFADLPRVRWGWRGPPTKRGRGRLRGLRAPTPADAPLADYGLRPDPGECCSAPRVSLRGVLVSSAVCGARRRPSHSLSFKNGAPKGKGLQPPCC